MVKKKKKENSRNRGFVSFREEPKILNLILLGELTGKGNMFLGISYKGINGTPSLPCLQSACFLGWRPRLSPHLTGAGRSPTYLTQPITYAETGASKGPQQHRGSGMGFWKINLSKPCFAVWLRLHRISWKDSVGGERKISVLYHCLFFQDLILAFFLSIPTMTKTKTKNTKTKQTNKNLIFTQVLLFPCILRDTVCKFGDSACECESFKSSHI